MQTAAKTNQTAFTSSPRTKAIIAQPTAPSAAMIAYTMRAVGLMGSGPLLRSTDTGGRSVTSVREGVVDMSLL
ncbi:hypothetical protein GCM10011366_21530 [Ornithinimicrobium tianjinense]|uniref:Uncharacterized protein n=1 Tax=Ornithinimicrobium tianjinense TaxID=1195761 RepID=A0A917BR86_9MICO|nr:hypothetical protein GCM10011366_21530 [Ornithinimicrobium tianjinense]